MKTHKLNIIHALPILFVLAMITGCTPKNQETTKKATVFEYNRELIKDAKPWTSENFKNNPKNFQFAIIGDRTGGANTQGTFDMALDQLNLLQPEFVINVGDLIEGYPIDEDDLNSQWEESDKMIANCKCPSFIP